MPDALVVRDSGLGGRGYYAATALQQGSLILRSDRYASALNEDQRGVRCDVCLLSTADRESIAIKRCAGCGVIPFCSTACQRHAWRKGLHSVECKAIAEIKRRFPNAQFPRSVLLLLRVLLRRNRDEAEYGKLIASLVSHWEDIDMKWKCDLSRAAGLGLRLKHVLETPIEDFTSSKHQEELKDNEGDGDDDQETRPFDEEDVLEAAQLLLKLNCNGFNVLDQSGQAIAVGVYPQAALFNHSCVPNCCAIFRGPFLEVRTITNVAKGEELLISYCDIALPKSVRLSTLREAYCFDCSCPRCCGETNYPNLSYEEDSLSEERQKQIDEAIVKAESQLGNGNLGESAEECEKHVLALPIKERKQSYRMFRLYSTLTDIYINIGNWDRAHLYSRKDAYPTNWPILGIHLMCAAKLQGATNCSDYRTMAENYKQAAMNLCVSHGSDHVLAREAEQAFREIMQIVTR